MVRFALPLSILLSAGCTNAPTPIANAKAHETGGGVTTGTPTKKTLRRVLEQPASIEPFEETPLVARITGYVDKVEADIGKQVKKGDVLAELSVPEMLQELAQKKALVVQARAEVDQALATFKAAEANVETAKAQVRETESAQERWKSEYKRVEALVADKVVDKQIRDETLHQYQSAEAKVQSAKAMQLESEAKRNKSSADIDAAKARVNVALAEEARTQALADYRYIRAPFAGIVTRRNIHTGHFLQPASGASAVLFQVARVDLLRIIADIPESDALHVAEGISAKIHVPVLKDQVFEGKVARTSGTLDARSRALRIEIDYPNQEGKLRAGTFANVVFTIELKDRLTLPASAIFTHADQPCCYRVESGKALRTPLKLGARDGQTVEVLKKQLRESVWENITGQEEIVLTNLGAITDGKELPATHK